MNKEAKEAFTTTGILAALAILYTILVQVIDVKPIGPDGSEVGFATINGIFRDMIGYHRFFYLLTEVFGIICILVAVMFAAVGALQLFRKKDIMKVNRKILLMGGIYTLVLLLYVVFEIFPVNYRPMIVDPEEGLEASYPSTHTMLSMCIVGCALVYFKKVVRNEDVRDMMIKACISIIFVTVVGRLLSGVHWFSDILGGFIISLAIISLYNSLVTWLSPRKKKQRRHRRRGVEGYSEKNYMETKG